MDQGDLRCQQLFGTQRRQARGPAGLPQVVGRAVHTEGPAQQGPGELGLLRMNEPVDGVYRLSCAKKAAAFFRILIT
jgi:hypothetical protein